MSDPINLPDGSTLTGVITFPCRECQGEVEVMVRSKHWDELQPMLDEEICDRCDSCRPDYFKRMSEYQRADDECCEC